jgi:hypothetical protein
VANVKTLKREYRLEEAEKLILQKALRFNYDNPRVVRETFYFINQLWSMKRGETKTLEVEGVHITVTCTSRLNGYDEIMERYIIE